jgi:membrane-associated phospholipid phosphatase
MLKAGIPEVKQMCLESGLILAAGSALCLALYLAGADAAVAKALFSPDAHWAWTVRQWSSVVLAVPVALGGILLFLSPKWSKKHMAQHQLAALMVLAVVVGAGICNQLVLQGLADRPRPRESVLVSTPGLESLHGHSMPSGHAAMGFAYVAPYFLLRRRRPKMAYGFLAFGLLSGGFIGFSRMVLGAHYLTDVLMAGVVGLSTGRVFAYLVEDLKVIGREWWGLGVAGALSGLVMGNHFEMSFSMPVGLDFTRTKLPCPLEVTHDASVQTPTLTIDLAGYGAPVSQIYPINDHGVVKLRKWGIYHGLACKAVLHAPDVSYD